MKRCEYLTYKAYPKDVIVGDILLDNLGNPCAEVRLIEHLEESPWKHFDCLDAKGKLIKYTLHETDNIVIKRLELI